MPEETIVAVYDSAAHADAAIADLRAANVPENAISRHAGTTGTAGAAPPPVREQGFWASLFGGDADRDTTVYDRSMDSGSSVVVVKVPQEHVDAVTRILERNNPIDIDERATGYGLTQNTAATTSTTSANASTVGVAGSMATPAAPRPAATTAARTAEESGTIQLAEESLTVGKRLVNRGGARIRRYVVETPVEEQVRLRDEKVTLDRRPVTDGRPVTAADFKDETIEVTEQGEEAVVGKTARVVEEVSLRKEATERVETVRDTVRKEEVEVERLPGSATTTIGTTTGTTGSTTSTGTTTTSTTVDPRAPKV